MLREEFELDASASSEDDEAIAEVLSDSGLRDYQRGCIAA
jgi:hypothetical protein